MTTLCPLHPWLDACDFPLSLAPLDPPFNVTDLAVDCCDINNRLAILQTLATHGYRYPWALGGIWSALTDEQAGRVVAEFVRRIGPDVRRPLDDRPVVVMSAWIERDGGALHPRHFRWGPARMWREISFGDNHHGRYVCVFDEGWLVDRWMPNGAPNEGPETGLAGKIAADTAARRSGALLWEDITP